MQCHQGTVWQMAELCRVDRLISAFVAAKFYSPCCKTTHRQRIFYNVFHPNKSQKPFYKENFPFFYIMEATDNLGTRLSDLKLEHVWKMGQYKCYLKKE